MFDKMFVDKKDLFKNDYSEVEFMVFSLEGEVFLNNVLV